MIGQMPDKNSTINYTVTLAFKLPGFYILFYPVTFTSQRYSIFRLISGISSQIFSFPKLNLNHDFRLTHPMQV